MHTLFRNWFVDFEFPNENGNHYKSSGGKMKKSNLGPIPSMWIIDKLEDTVLKIGTGADAIKKAPIVDYDTGIKCVRVGDMTNGRNVENWAFTNITDQNFKNYQLNKSDIIITRTAVNGLSYFVEKDLKAVCNNGLIRLKVNNDYNPYYIYQIMKTSHFMNYIKMIEGETSTRPNMKINYLLGYEFINPGIELQNEFIRLINPIKTKISLINEENTYLLNLRDTLLPKLMSGEINIPDTKV